MQNAISVVCAVAYVTQYFMLHLRSEQLQQRRVRMEKAFESCDAGVMMRRSWE
jgi:hypothetical protein